MPPEAMPTTTRYLELADTALPNRIEALSITGSIALGDYVPGQSDIDFVAVTADRLTADEIQAIARVHEDLQRERPRPWFSGVYVTREDLAHDPRDLTGVPSYLEGEFRVADGFDANPVTWLTLSRYPLAVRGPARPDVWADARAVRDWTLDNLNSYWRRWSVPPCPNSAGAALLRSDEAAVWSVSGVTRLHYTLATGDVTSKSGACRYALERFPEPWHRIAREALTLRAGGETTYADPEARGREAVEYVAWTIEDANARFALRNG